MSRRRWIIAVVVLIALLAGAEVALRQWQTPKARIQIINESDGAMEDLVLDYADTKIPVGRLGLKESTHVWVTAGPKGVIHLDFRHKGKPPKRFHVLDFDPGQNLRDSFKLVVIVKADELHQYTEEDELNPNPKSLGERVKQWMSSEFEPEKK